MPGGGGAFRVVLISSAAVFVVADPGTAQAVLPDVDVAPEVLDPINELQREIEERARRDEIENFRAPAVPEADDTPSGAPADQEAGPCLDVGAVEIAGATLLDQIELSGFSMDLVPGCIGESDIGLLMQRIDKAYADKGHITTRTYIPEQDLAASGVLQLTVIEGFIEDVQLLDESGEPITGVRRQLLLGSAFPQKTPTLFQLRDLEQAVDQLSRPQSAKAKLRLEPGSEAGGSQIVIERQSADRVRGIVEINNTGAVSTGQRQFRINLAADGVLSASDIWSVTYQGGENSNALSLSTSVPFGYNTFSAFVSYSDFFIPLTPLSELFGETVSYGGSWSRVVKRTAAVRQQLGINLQARQGSRFVNGVGLSPQDIATIDFRLSTVNDTQTARWLWDIGPVAGLPVFNDPNITPATGPDIPQTDFVALRGGIVRVGKGKGGPIRWTTALRVQATHRALFSSEQVALGARSVTRGFEQTDFSADNAAYLRIEGETKLPSAPGQRFGNIYNKYKDKVRAFGFLDTGVGHAFAGDDVQSVGAFGAGMRAQFGRLNMNFSVEKSILEDNEFTLGRGEILFRASLSAKIF